MGKKMNITRGRVYIIVKRPPEPVEKSRLKAVLSKAPIFILFTLAVVFTSKTLFVDYWGWSLFGDPESKRIEQEERERKELLAQYEANKKKLSQEVRTDLFIAQNRFNKMLKKYLSPREQTVYMMLDYISSYRGLDRDEKRLQSYYFEKLLSNMTPEENELIEEDMQVFDRIKGELEQLKSQKPETDKEGEGKKPAGENPGVGDL